MCGNILRGRFDPGLPFFTPGGSFWTNSTSELLASTCEAERQSRTRNRCHGEGYESVALVPLRHAGQALGLIQLNDLRRDRFSLPFIQTMERLADSLAMSLAQRQAQEALLESEAHFRHLFENMTTGVAVYEPVDGGRDFTILDLNQAGARYAKVCREEILGRLVTEIFPGLEEMGLLACFRETLASGEPTFLPVREYRDGRTTMWAENRVFRLPSGRIVAMFDDRTEQRQLEGRLLHMQKMDAIGQLAGGVAHDFNNQLTGVLGYAELLIRRLEDPNLKRLAENIATAARRSADLTRKLLAFSRQGQFQCVSVDLHRLIAETVEMLLHSIDKRIRLVQQLEAPLAVVMGDPSQLQNALLNLAVNARDAMPEGGVLTFTSAHLDLTSTEAQGLGEELVPGAYVEIRIEDTGCGMPPAVREHIFEPFFTTKEAGKGTGMGLASVYGTVQQHQGAIAVTSQIGVGTAFRILLPLTEAPSPGEARSSGRRSDQGQRRCILVVDDEDLIRELVKTVLEDAGNEVLAVGNGHLAVDIYRQHWQRIDLVVLDVVMPELDGVEAFLAMQAINPAIRAVMASGFSINDRLQGILADGRQAFIQKPYDLERLLALVDERIAT
jgi:PAS domain S-box-containing protein